MFVVFGTLDGANGGISQFKVKSFSRANLITQIRIDFKKTGLHIIGCANCKTAYILEYSYLQYKKGVKK